MSEPALARLARFVAEDPMVADGDTIAVLRDGVIDTLGCIHAGVATEVARRTRTAVAAMAGGSGPARVIGTEMMTTRPQAAFLNAVAGHALDFDDWEIPGNTHPTVVLLPALLAVATEETSGRDLAHAYLAGFEVIARLGEALNFDHYDAGWHSTATLGAIGAAAAAGRLMRLDTDHMTAAMSLAASTASGYTCQFGSHAKPVQAGFASRAGVEAASLAAAGLSGQAHVLDHSRGKAALMGGVPAERLHAVFGRLGNGLALAEHGLVLKPWPSCGYTHRIMTCALALKERVDTKRIARIDLHLPDFHTAVLPFCRPKTRNEALFSLPFVAAMGLTHGALTLADIDAKAWAEPDIVRLIELSATHPYRPRRPGLNYAAEDPDRMVVTLTDGTCLEESCVYPVGAPQASMTADMFWQKFTANTGPVSKDWVSRLRGWPDQAAIRHLLSEEGPIH